MSKSKGVIIGVVAFAALTAIAYFSGIFKKKTVYINRDIDMLVDGKKVIKK
jgi:hypothetical protein